MISNIIGTNGVHVFNGLSSGIYVNSDFSQLGHGVPGELRMLGSTTYVWNNGCWTVVNSTGTTVELTLEVQKVIDWAQRKMRHEQELEELLKKYPALQSAKDQFDTVHALVREHE